MHTFLLWTHLLLAAALAVPAEGAGLLPEGGPAGCADRACCCEAPTPDDPSAAASERSPCPCSAPAPAPVRAPAVVDAPSPPVLVPPLVAAGAVREAHRSRSGAHPSARDGRPLPGHRPRTQLCVWTI